MLNVKMVTEDKYKPVYAHDTDACMDIKAKGYIMQMFVRSSIGINKNLCLANGTGIIDNGYKDEIMIALYNFGNKPVIIKDGERICQFVILPRPQINTIFVQDDENFRQGDRGGGIGSTNFDKNGERVL